MVQGNLPTPKSAKADTTAARGMTVCHHPLMNLTDGQVSDAIVGLLLDRAPTATICPSEAARALAPDDWRPLMPRVRAVAFALAKDGVVEIRQGGRVVSSNEPLRGPIRLGFPDAPSPGDEDAS